MEQEPNGLGPNEPGAKLDSGKLKASVLADFGNALTEVAKVGDFGAGKYSRGGFLHVENWQERYFDAFYRHLLAMGSDMTSVDSDSKCLHLAAVVWNGMALLELLARNHPALKVMTEGNVFTAYRPSKVP